MVRKVKIKFETLVKISQILIALSTLLAPILWIWNKFEIPDFVDFELLVKALITGIYAIFIYLLYNQIFRGSSNAEE